MQIYQRKDGRYIAATYIPTKGRFKAALTKNGKPNEASSIDDLQYARDYGSIESVARALRKRKAGELT